MILEWSLLRRRPLFFGGGVLRLVSFGGLEGGFLARWRVDFGGVCYNFVLFGGFGGVWYN